VFRTTEEIFYILRSIPFFFTSSAGKFLPAAQAGERNDTMTERRPVPAGHFLSMPFRKVLPM
jgi:hypothetical protein